MKPSVQVQKPSTCFGDRGTKFSSLGGLRSLKLTPQPELEADLVLSVTQKAGMCGRGGTSLHMHKVCVLDLTGL